MAEKMFEEMRQAKADSTKGAAPKIGEYLHRAWRPTLLMAGYCIETGLKAVYVSAADRSQDDRGFEIHDLINLAALADVALSAREERLCQLLTEFVIHLGRYPTPSKKMFSYKSYYYGETTLETFIELDRRIAERLSQHPIWAHAI